MSYILEALKKSESERNQGRVPDLSQQIRMIHRKRKRGIPAVAWLVLALLVNAVVLAALFWPGSGIWSSSAPESPESSAAMTVAEPDPAAGAADEPSPAGGEVVRPDEAAEPESFAAASGDQENESPTVVDVINEEPTLIVPSQRAAMVRDAETLVEEESRERVPHLVEMPMSFQREVPDLVFNSHVYASDPRDRRVMINNRYLRTGDDIGPLTVDRITEQGVELSMHGQRFRVGVVRDWSSPR